MAETALEWIEGGGLSFTVPAAMLDPSVPMSSVLSARTWQEQLSADERASLRRFLPDPTASEEDVRALVAALFGDGDGDGGGDTHVNMHFGNPAERVWREIQARERDPEVMAHRNAIGVVERGAHELEVRLHHARVARAGMGMLRKFRDADADAAGGDGGDGGGGGGVTREDRLRAWRRRDATPEPDRSHRVGGSDDDDAANDNDETKNTRKSAEQEIKTTNILFCILFSNSILYSDFIATLLCVKYKNKKYKSSCQCAQSAQKCLGFCY